MHPTLRHNLFLIKEHYGLFKAANNYDVVDPETGEVILCCREDRLSPLTRLLRFTDYRQMTPFDIEIRTPEGEPVISVRRGFSLFLSQVDVTDGATGVRIGGFKQKLFSIGGAFTVLDIHDHPLCELKGKWTGWEFRFMAGDHELARVTKKWQGVGKEFFTSADNYILSISEYLPSESQIRELIMAAVMCIDMVLKE